MVLATVAAMVVTGELFDFLGFVAKHPDILWHLFLASGAMALGQVLPHLMIQMTNDI